MEKVTLEEDFLEALKHYYLSPDAQNLEHFLESETAFSIFDCFINLAIVVYEQQKQQEEQQLTTAKGLFRDDKVSCYESIYEPQKVIAIADIFSEVDGQKPQNHILVSGRAGIGKTTFCQYIATHWAAEYFDSLGDWIKDFTGVIWIPLRKLKELTTRTSLSAFIHTHCLLPADQLKIAMGHVERALNNANYRWLFLLDGADEVLEEIKNPQHPAYYLFAELKAKPDWMLTTRPHQLELRSLGELRHLELTGFTWPNIVQYIQTFFETVGKAALAENLLRNIRLNPNLRGIAHVPMQLELLCSIWQDSNGELNVEDMTFTELYQKLIVGLLRRYLNKQGVDTRALMDDEILSHALVKPLVAGLQQIAWHMFETNTLIFEVKKNQRLMNTIEKNQRDLLFNQVHLLKVTGDQKSQLIDKKYYFVHLTFQEFFVAWYIVDAIQTHKFPNHDGNLSQLLTKTLFNPRYEIVYWFVAGLLKAYAPEELENFFKLTSQMYQYDLSSYLTLQTIRYQEEANFYAIESGKLITVNLTTLNIEHVISNIGNKSNSEAIRLAHYLNASPNFCRMLAIEDKLVITLDRFWTTKQPTYLLHLALNTWALKDQSLNYLQTLLQHPQDEKNTEAILQLLLSIISHYPELAINLNQEPLLRLLNHRNYFLVQWLIKLAAFFIEVNELLVDFLISAIKNQRDIEAIIRPTLDTLLTFAYSDKLTNEQKLKLRKVIFSCIADESGWLLRELAELLVTITDSEESYSVFLKNLFNKSLPTRFSVKSRPDYREANQLSFTMTPYLIARVLTALVKTNDQFIIDAILRLLKKEIIKKGQKNFKIIENILCAFLNANYYADDVLSWAFLIIETPKIPLIYKRMALQIISHTPTLSSYTCKKLEKLYQGQNVLLSLTCFMMLVKHKQVVVTDAEIVQKLITYLFHAQQDELNLTDLTKQVRGEALQALFSFNLSQDNTLQLLKALNLSDFLVDGYSTFKGLLIKLLSKYINEYSHILVKLQELANNTQEQAYYVYLTGAFSCLNKLPNSIAKKLLEWLSLSNVEKQENMTLILAVASTCKKFIKKDNYLHHLVNAKFKTAQESEWLFLAEFLASIGELSIEDLRTLTQSYLNLMGENILTIYGHSGANQQKVLIEFLLPLLQQYDTQSFEAWSFYRVLRNFDLTHYLSQLATHSANSFLLEGIPTKSLINSYISIHDNNFLKLFYQRVSTQGLIVYYYQNCLVWYEQNERIEVQVSEELLGEIKQQLTGVLASHAKANSINDNTPNADVLFNKQQENKNLLDPNPKNHNSIIHSHVNTNVVINPESTMEQTNQLVSKAQTEIAFSFLTKYVLKDLIEVKDRAGNVISTPRLIQLHAVRLAFKFFIQDQLITYLAGIPGYNFNVPKTVFISYAWAKEGSSTYYQDKLYEGYVEKLAKDLKSIGCKVYLDRWFDKAGQPLTEFLERMEQADCFIAIGSYLYLAKYQKIAQLMKEKEHVVRAEGQILNYIATYSSNWRKKIIPVLLEGTPEETLPPLLRPNIPLQLHYEDYFEEFFKLVKAIYSIDNQDKSFKKLTQRFFRSLEALTKKSAEDLQSYVLTTKQIIAELESSHLKELPIQASAKSAYHTQPVPGVHHFQGNNTNQLRNNNTNINTNDLSVPEKVQSPTPK